MSITWIVSYEDTTVTNDRISVNSDGNTHTSQLQFLYLSDEDDGLYICKVTILNITDSMPFELESVLSMFPSWLWFV